MTLRLLVDTGGVSEIGAVATKKRQPIQLSSEIRPLRNATKPTTNIVRTTPSSGQKPKCPYRHLRPPTK